ncbi:hypothetical protein RF11_08714 [Thelohanellus kitauei]|uniref:Uncharacterized protein n=1 Tax=Thelohanellus kitauei TaxID=669202 RepID=A0A0C2IMN5_THEKT|nr:hypothetical protein RF11_08714 [Thelohanellus kitauei]
MCRKVQKNSDLLETYKRDDSEFDLCIKMILNVIRKSKLRIFSICAGIFQEKLILTLEMLMGKEQNPCFQSNYGIKMNGHSRTDNSIEGWYSGFSKMVKIFHLSLFKFVEYTRLDENYQGIICQQDQIESLQILKAELIAC